MINFVVMASGSGSTFEALAKKLKKSKTAKIAAVISNKQDAKVLTRAKNLGIEGFFVDHKQPQENIDAEIKKIISNKSAQFVMLLGYLKKISQELVDILPIYNIHPAYDIHKYGGKGMYGLNVHKAIVETRESYSGATIHKVNSIYDDGKILMQTKKVKVKKTDTPEQLAARVLKQEHKLVPKFINQIVSKMQSKTSQNT